MHERPRAELRRQGDDLISHDMTADAADLSLATSGRAPLLYSHMRTLDGLLGALTTAWLDSGALHFVARLAAVPDADRLWTFLADSFPISVSLGAEIVAAEVTGSSPWGGQRIAVRRWRLVEISACLHGTNQGAHMVRLDSDEGRELLATRKPADLDAVRDRLRLDRWERWAVSASLRIADALGADRHQTCELLCAEVEQHSEQLVADLAA